MVGELRVQCPAGAQMLECPPSHESLVVASEHDLCGRHRQVKALRRLVTAGGKVAETPHSLDLRVAELGAKRPEGHGVGMDV